MLVWVSPNHSSSTRDLEKPILALPLHWIGPFLNNFFFSDPHGEDVLLAQGLDQLQNKLGLSLFEEENRSPINVDDDDWLMRDLSGI